MNKIFFIVFTAAFLLSVPLIHAIDGAGPFLPSPLMHRPSKVEIAPSNRAPDDEPHDKKTLSGIARPPVIMWDGTEVVPDPTTYPPMFTNDGVVMQNGVPVATVPIRGPLMWNGVEVTTVTPSTANDGVVMQNGVPVATVPIRGPLMWNGVEVTTVTPSTAEDLLRSKQEEYLRERKRTEERRENNMKGKIAKREQSRLSSHL